MELLENNWGKIRCPQCDSVMDKIIKDDIKPDWKEGIEKINKIREEYDFKKD